MLQRDGTAETAFWTLPIDFFDLGRRLPWTRPTYLRSSGRKGHNRSEISASGVSVK